MVVISLGRGVRWLGKPEERKKLFRQSSQHALLFLVVVWVMGIILTLKKLN